jgi:hypothetical protein
MESEETPVLSKERPVYGDYCFNIFPGEQRQSSGDSSNQRDSNCILPSIYLFRNLPNLDSPGFMGMAIDPIFPGKRPKMLSDSIWGPEREMPLNLRYGWRKPVAPQMICREVKNLLLSVC